MHIAICDDNVADRKQLERLLKRESDKRASVSGILYTDSYGNAPALLANPMQYDAFYIDMCKTEGVTGVTVARDLLEKGVHAPIIMCCSDLNYRDYEFPENVIFLDKPIRTAELSDSVDHALSLKAQAPTLIELRQDKDTVYVTEDQITYACEQPRYLEVTLTDGRKIMVSSSAANFFAQVESHPSFFLPTPKLLINGRHIQKLGFNKLVMTDGTSFKISHKCMNYARYAYEEFHVGKKS